MKTFIFELATKRAGDLSIAYHHISLTTLRPEYIIYFYSPIKPSLDELISTKGGLDPGGELNPKYRPSSRLKPNTLPLFDVDPSVACGVSVAHGSQSSGPLHVIVIQNDLILGQGRRSGKYCARAERT